MKNSVMLVAVDKQYMDSTPFGPTMGALAPFKDREEDLDYRCLVAESITYLGAFARVEGATKQGELIAVHIPLQVIRGVAEFDTPEVFQRHSAGFVKAAKAE